MKTASLVLILASLSAAGNVAAGTPTAARSEVREQRQEVRIVHGAASGELTAPEARRLHHGQQRVDAAQSAAQADGVVSRGEKHRLERLQDQQSRRIARQKHDRQQRGD